ncbi:FecR family protein [Flavobacterium succinicans]|uniref:Fec operon regulator FecR n=1 Tax=Flavobacterium succinicans TaxID=29536 RepID=A0A199XQ58_9FLAO|nr:FecR family protein [Flavobacterium succinicans]OAZ03464.1 fec operon regulator FecR [Flavobacterium succinicans]
MYQKEVFKKLMRQYVSGEISTEGKALLLQMIDDPLYAKDLDAILRKNYDQVQTSEAETLSTATFIHSLRERINSNSKTEEEQEEEIATPLFNWRRIAAAASVLLVLGIGFYKYTKKTSTPTIVATEKNIITPGTSGAILTLADGSQIVLDSVANGVLANQNSAVISKKGGTLVYTPGNSNTAAQNNMATPRGRQYQLVLSDGTKVWLNASSSITFPTTFIHKERRVAITGEAYFEVAKDKNHPFIVTANDIEVKVLGTHFNINSYPEEKSTKTTLLEGSVLVSNKKEKSLLEPGQQATQSQTGTLNVKKLENLDEIIAWRKGLFYFSNTSLENVMQQISRWYDVNIVFEKGVPARSFDGEISRELNLDQVLKILETNNIHFKIEGKTIRVLP